MKNSITMYHMIIKTLDLLNIKYEEDDENIYPEPYGDESYDTIDIYANGSIGIYDCEGDLLTESFYEYLNMIDAFKNVKEKLDSIYVITTEGATYLYSKDAGENFVERFLNQLSETKILKAYLVHARTKERAFLEVENCSCCPITYKDIKDFGLGGN